MISFDYLNHCNKTLNLSSFKIQHFIINQMPSCGWIGKEKKSTNGGKTSSYIFDQK